MAKKPKKARADATKPKVAGASSTLVKAQYDAAGHGRRLRGWSAPQTGPNRATQGAATLRARSRDAGRNEWAADSAVTQWAVNLVGTGIQPRPRTRDAARKQALLALWLRWCGEADADEVYDFYGLQNLVARNWIEAGELFVRLRWRRPEDGLAVPLQLQLLESEMVPDQDGLARNGNPIRRGIEFDAIGRRVAYHALRHHPGDGVGDASTTVRIPADQILHIYEPTRPGQLRGVSDFAPILAKLRGVGNFDDAVLHRQELANLFTAFIKKTGMAGIPHDPSLDPVSGLPVQLDASGVPLAAMEPGMTQELLEGEDIVFSNPPGPGAEYDQYMRVQGMQIAAGSHLPYELLTGDLRDVSDRTLRVLIQGFRRHCEQRQWLVLIPQLCEPVRRAWATAAMLADALPLEMRDDALDTLWVPQGWDYIHPLQDVQADALAVEKGLRTRSSVITRRGDDPEALDEEAAADREREQRLGLNFAAPAPAPANQAPEETEPEIHPQDRAAP